MIGMGAKVCMGSESMGLGTLGSDSIAYVMDDVPSHGAMKADDQMLYFEPLGMQSFGSRDKEKLSEQGVA